MWKPWCVTSLLVCAVNSVQAQPVRSSVAIDLNGGAYVPAAPFGTFGFATGEEEAAQTLGAAVRYRFGRKQEFSAGISVNWVWGLATRVVPTDGCTGACAPSRIEGGRNLLAFATVTWEQATGIGVLSPFGGVGAKSYRNGDGISACDNQFCYDTTYFQESLTDLAGEVGLGWRPRGISFVGIRISDVVSRYKTGRLQHNFLLLLTLHPL